MGIGFNGRGRVGMDGHMFHLAEDEDAGLGWENGGFFDAGFCISLVPVPEINDTSNSRPLSKLVVTVLLAGYMYCHVDWHSSMSNVPCPQCVLG